jgi:hypothetical protein
MPRLAALVLSLLVLSAAPAPAADRKFDPDAAAKAVAPFLDGQTVSVIHADLTRFDADAHFKQLAALAGLPPNELAGPKKMFGDLAKKLTDAGVKDVFVVISLADLPKNPPFVVLPLDKGADAKALLALTDAFKEFHPNYEPEQIGQAVVVAAPPTRKRLKDLKPEPRPEVAKAFAAGDGLVRVVAVLTPDVQKQIEQESPTLPKALGGGSIKVLTDGVRWSVYTLETSPKVRLRWVVQAADKDAAKALHDLALTAKKALLGQGQAPEGWPELEKWLDALTPQLDGDRLTATVEEAIIASFLKRAVVKVREAAMRILVSNNLHQLGIAVNNKAVEKVTTDLLPVANFDEKGKPLLSWRVHILPYVNDDESAKLYKEFKLDEPWDSEHNKKLITKMPKVFASPSNPKLAADGKTTMLAPVHKDAVFTGDKTARRLTDLRSISHTILLVDADDSAAVIWTKPDDLKLDPKDPHKGLGFRSANRCMVLIADGSVRSIPKNVDKMALWAWFMLDGKKPDLP